MKADYSNIWQMRDDLSMRDSLIVRPAEPHISAEYRLAIIRGEVAPSKPLAFQHNLGEIARDIVAASAVGWFLLSDRVIRSLRAAGCTGWSTYPVRVNGNNGDICGYHGLSVNGRCAERDSHRSERVVKGDGKVVRWRGLYFVDDEWDGTDVFLSKLKICVTRRAYDAISNIPPSNISFIPSHDVMFMDNLRESSS